MTLRPGVRLAVDLGQARVGVARTDPAGLLATPVATLRRDTGAETDMDRIVDLAEETGAIEILVGLPRSMDGAERTSARTVRRWAGGSRGGRVCPCASSTNGSPPSAPTACCTRPAAPSAATGPSWIRWRPW